MGTRADFYVGQDEEAEWLGSIAWDGYPEGIKESEVFEAADELQYRERVQRYLESRDDGTLPKMGWPWPWEDSCTTDYAYAFTAAGVRACSYGHGWFDPLQQEPVADEYRDEMIEMDGEENLPTTSFDATPVSFPNMKSKQRVSFGSRSGMMLVGEQGIIDPEALDLKEEAERAIDEAADVQITTGPPSRESGLAEPS